MILRTRARIYHAGSAASCVPAPVPVFAHGFTDSLTAALMCLIVEWIVQIVKALRLLRAAQQEETMKKARYPFTLLSILVLLAGCYGLGGMSEREAPSEYFKAGAAEEAPAQPRSAPAPQPSVRADLGMAQPSLMAAETTSPESFRLEEQAGERKRVFSGFCTLLVDNVEKTRTEIADLAEDSGGYVETVAERTVVIRVPAERFDEIFAVVLGFGEVSHKSIETYDVTEFFRDQEVRLEIARKTRGRLYSLLEKTTDVEERLEILREIKRLTEEVERIERSLELLQRRINLSRITVELTPRLPSTGYDRSSIPFDWIANLNPLYPSLRNPKGRVELDLSEEFAVFTEESAFRAESAEGTRIRIGSARNHPRGDTEFWGKALAYHLSPYYKSAEELDLGPFKAVLFTSKDPKPFSYLVAVAAQDEGKIRPDLVILEIFFPDQRALQARLADLKASVAQMEM
jgi:hypothetical protein